MLPTIVFDGDCGFCKRWIARWHERTGGRVLYLPLQEPGLLARLGIPLSDALAATQFIDSDGRRYQGAEGIFRALLRAPGRHRWIHLLRLPILSWIAAQVYGLIARHRVFASQVEAWVSRRSTRRRFGHPHLPGPA